MLRKQLSRSLVWALAALAFSRVAVAADAIHVLTISDAIGPATSSYLIEGIEDARGAQLVVLELDTPGGLDSAMRDMIQAILASDVPLATYVSPRGARAASAGTYILYASHIAAMAPATNLGAATPVAIGGSPAPDAPEAEEAEEGSEETAEQPSPRTPSTATERKAVNDAVAYIRGLAERRGRNADWAERAVRDAESLSASAALEAGVIDLIAEDLDDLLSQLDGRTIELDGGESVVLETADAPIERIEPDWRTKLLAVISNPTVAYLLMLIGIYGLILEGYNPGALVPGVVGAISLLLALFAFQVIPVNYAGLALIVLGIILIVAETLVPSFGVLGFGGVLALMFGSVIMFDSEVPGFSVATSAIAAIGGVAGIAMLATAWFTYKTRFGPIVSGAEEMIGAEAVALENFSAEGNVRVHGEIWKARSGQPVTEGDELVVTALNGLILDVKPRSQT